MKGRLYQMREKSEWIQDASQGLYSNTTPSIREGTEGNQMELTVSLRCHCIDKNESDAVSNNSLRLREKQRRD
jgi:hypothetical protein